MVLEAGPATVLLPTIPPSFPVLFFIFFSVLSLLGTVHLATSEPAPLLYSGSGSFGVAAWDWEKHFPLLCFLGIYWSHSIYKKTSVSPHVAEAEL